MADSVRGDGVFRLMSALAALVENPERLDRERERFNKSPPAYRSNFSHNSTLSQSPELRSEERKWQLIRERWASFAGTQFSEEQDEERKRIEEASLNRTGSVPIGKSFSELAEENVKARWVEQGIWNEKWKDSCTIGKWKHEEPSELESESEAESEPSCSPFCPPPQRAEAKRGRPKRAEELQRSAERRLVREREREASRPFHQFVYQVSKERERIQAELNPPKVPSLCPFDFHLTCYGTADSYRHVWAADRQAQDEPNEEKANAETPRDINSTAYERVKNKWIKRGIWNGKWGVLPGMSWKHEQPQEDMLREELGDDPISVQASPPRDNGSETKRVSPRSISGAHLPAEGTDALVQASPPGDNGSETEQVSPRSVFGDYLPTEWTDALVQASPPGDNRYGTEQEPPRSLFAEYQPVEWTDGNGYGTEQARPWSLFPDYRPAESNNQASSIQDASQQEEPPTSTVSGVLESHGYGTGGAPSGPVTGSPNSSPQDLLPAPGPEEVLDSDISHPCTASNSRRSARIVARRPTLSQGRRSEDGQALQMARAALGPVHSAKVSKSRRKSAPGQRLRPNASELLSEARQSSPGLDVPAPPAAAAPAPLRRSRRLQEAAHNGGSQSRPGQTSAPEPKPSLSARPRGVSKRRSSTARHRAR
ncbi:unnamed protein product [Clonostachys rhizophaga]|uniref:Uncharacterized protein n=1 Tax=Clonostachys rhizophaga TaxID=160324 RepID=A0A9N9VGI4_9HYPO|nr:unnamed protein product [Clonostachys rhizophaga]